MDRVVRTKHNIKRDVSKSETSATVFDVPLMLLILGAIVSVLVSCDTRSGLSSLAVILACVILYYLVCRLANPALWAQVAVCVALPVASYYVLQYRYLWSSHTSRVGAWLGHTLSGPFPRIGPWKPLPNSVATLVVGLIPLSIGLISAHQSRAWRVCDAISACALFLALIVSDSRGAWLGLLIGAGVWLASRWRYGIVLLGCASVLGIGGMIGYVLLSGGEGMAQVPLVGPFLYEFAARPGQSFRLAQDFAFTGIGLGNVFGMVYSTYALLIRHIFVEHAPNLYATVWLGHGLLGGIGLLWLILSSVTIVVHEHTAGHPTTLFQASWVGLLAVLVHGLSDARQYVDLWTMWPLYLLLGMMMATHEAGVSPRLPSGRWMVRFRRYWWGIVAFVGVVGVIACWRPLVGAAYANHGAVLQAKAELGSETPDKDARLSLAVTKYQRALQIDPRNRTAGLRLGNLAVSAGRYGEGIAYLEPVWRRLPRDPTARKALGLAYVWVGRVDEAAELLQESHNIIAELNAWGGWHRQEGRKQLAVYAFQTSLALDPSQSGLRDLLAAMEKE